MPFTTRDTPRPHSGCLASSQLASRPRRRLERLENRLNSLAVAKPRLGGSCGVGVPQGAVDGEILCHPLHQQAPLPCSGSFCRPRDVPPTMPPPRPRRSRFGWSRRSRVVAAAAPRRFGSTASAAAAAAAQRWRAHLLVLLLLDTSSARRVLGRKPHAEPCLCPWQRGLPASPCETSSCTVAQTPPSVSQD